MANTLDDILAQISTTKAEQDKLKKAKDDFRSLMGVGPEKNKELGIEPGSVVREFIDPFGLIRNPDYEKALPVAQERERVDKLFQALVSENLASEVGRSNELKGLSQLLGGKDGEVRVKDLNPLVMSQAEQLGIPMPQKEVKGPLHDLDILGPHQAAFSGTPASPSGNIDPRTSSIFQSLGLESGEGSLPAAFSDPGNLTPFGGKLAEATGSVQGLDAELLAREQDPGLQAPVGTVGSVPDLEAQLGTDEILQIGKALDTRLRTPQAGQELVSPQQMDETLTAIEAQAGVPIGSTPRPRTQMSTTNANNLVTNVTSILGKGITEGGKDRRQQQYFSQERQMFDLKTEVSKDLVDHKAGVSLQNSLIIKQFGFEKQQALEENRASQREQLAHTQAQVRHDNRIKELEKKAELSGREGELNRDLERWKMHMRGKQSLDVETLRSANRLALQETQGGLNKERDLKKFYLEFIQSNPSVSGELLDLVTQLSDQDLDPTAKDAIMSALNEEFESTVNSKLVENRVNTIVNTDIFAQTLHEKELALFNAKEMFSKQGVDTKLIDRHLEQIQKIRETGGQNITINNNPLGGSGKEREDVAALRGVLQDIAWIGQLYSPEFTGFFDDLTAKGTSFVGMIGERESDFRSAVNEMKGRIVQARAGAAIGPAEAELLLAALPSLDGTDSQFLSNMKNLLRTTQNLLNEKYSLLGFNARKRSEELEEMGKTKSQIEQILILERLLSPRERGGK